MEWTNPFFLIWPHGSCVECDVKLESGDFAQLEVRKGTRDQRNKACRHYDCNDPRGSELFRIAAEDYQREVERTHGLGNKSKVNRWYR